MDGEEVPNHHEVWIQRQGAHSIRIGDRHVIADPNTAVFHNVREEFRTRAAIRQRQKSTVVLLSADLIRELLGQRENFPLSAAPLSAAASLAHFRLLRHLGSREALPIEIEETTLILLRLLMGSGGEDSSGKNSAAVGRRRRAQQEMVEAVRHLIALRFGEKLLLDEIARAIGSSPFHLSRIFSREVGVPIHRFLTQIRLRAALDRMADSGADLSRIALEVGFSSHSHFTTAFRREYGLPPGKLHS